MSCLGFLNGLGEGRRCVTIDNISFQIDSVGLLGRGSFSDIAGILMACDWAWTTARLDWLNAAVEVPHAGSLKSTLIDNVVVHSLELEMLVSQPRVVLSLR
jgi:hypothetical protein